MIVSPREISKFKEAWLHLLLMRSLLSPHQYVEDIKTKLPPMSEELSDKIDDLSQEIKDRKLAEKVFQAESHAAQLNDSSAVLDGYAMCGWKCLHSLTLLQEFRQAERVENHFQVLIFVIMNKRAAWLFYGRS